MRTAFIRTLLRIAEQDNRVMLVVGDLGFGVVETFASRFPTQFLNVGVAEQNMTGVAAGLALSGKIVFTYSIANFPTLRCLEQIRNDVCYHEANVKIVSVGGGVAYGSLGMSHHATEDLAIMRALPNMTVVAPGDPVETGLATAAATYQSGPCYLRLGRAGEPVFHQSNPAFEFGKAITVRQGEDITLISTGGMLHTAVQVSGRLRAEGVHARVLSMHTLKPLDSKSLLAAARETSALFTIEEHSMIGGLGSAVSEVLLESGYSGLFRRIAFPDRFNSVAGSIDYLRRLHGLDDSAICARILTALGTTVKTYALSHLANQLVGQVHDLPMAAK